MVYLNLGCLIGCSSATTPAPSHSAPPASAPDCAPLTLPAVEAPPAPACANDDLTSYDGLLVFAPHPDDEILGFAGLSAAYRARGKPVDVVVVTDGDAYCEACQFWKNSDFDGPLCSAAELSNFATAEIDSFAEIRRRESTDAASHLDLDAPEFLGYPDTGLGASRYFFDELNEPDRNLHRSDFSVCDDCATCGAGYGGGAETGLTPTTLLDSLRERLESTSERTLVATTHWLDNHGDHSALGDFVRRLNAELDSPRTLAFSVIHADTSKEHATPECWFPGPTTPDCACMNTACAAQDSSRVETLSNFRLRPDWPATVPDDVVYDAETDPVRHLCLSEEVYAGEEAKKLRAIRAFESQLGTLARQGQHPPGLDGLIDCSGYLISFVRSTEAFYVLDPGADSD